MLLRVMDAVSLGAFLAFLASALVLIVLWVAMLFRQLGAWGILLGVVTAPLAAVFPFVHRVTEGTYPGFGLRVWIVSVLGVAVSMGWRQLRPENGNGSSEPSG